MTGGAQFAALLQARSRGLLVAGYACAAFFALAYLGAKLHAPDEFEYFNIGQNLLDRATFSLDGVTPTAWRSPGLPALIAILWLIFPSIYLLKVFMLGCWGATGLVISRLSSHIAGSRAGWMAALLYLCYVFELYAATTLYPQTLGGLLLIGAVALLITNDRLSPRGRLLLLGLSAYQVFLIPNLVVVPAILYPYAVLRKKLSVRTALMSGCVIVLAVLAWCGRNEQAIGAFSFTTSMGVTLYEGNRDAAASAKTPVADEPASEIAARSLKEVDGDKLYRAKAAALMSSHPWETAARTLGKFAYWFAYENQYETTVQVPFIHSFSLLTAVIYYPVLILALLAVWSQKPRLREAAVLSWAIYLAGALTYVLFLTRIRYRLPFDTMLFAVAPCMLSELLGRCSGLFRLNRLATTDRAPLT